MSDNGWSYTAPDSEEKRESSNGCSECMETVQYLEEHVRQIEHGVTLRLVAIEGMRACMVGIPREECPYEAEEKDVWLMGYAEQELELQKDVALMLARQAIKSQAMHVQNFMDVADEVAAEPQRWWLPYLAPEALDALKETPRDTLLLEDVVKHGIALATGGAFRHTEEGIVVDNRRGDLVVNLEHAVAKYLRHITNRSSEHGDGS